MRLNEDDRYRPPMTAEDYLHLPLTVCPRPSPYGQKSASLEPVPQCGHSSRSNTRPFILFPKPSFVNSLHFHQI